MKGDKMLQIPKVLLCDEFRQIMRSDITLSKIKHKATKRKQRRITDAMTQLLVNTCDKFQRHKDYPIWNSVKLTRDYQKSVVPNDFQLFQNVLTDNDFVINHHYQMPTKNSIGKTKSVIIPHNKIQLAVDYLAQQNIECVELNADVVIDWKNCQYFGSNPIPSRVRINTLALKKFSNSVKDVSQHLHNKWNLHLRLADAQDNDGWMRQDYKVSNFGRLIGYGISSLQTMPKVLLKEVLAGCYELDVNASALSLLPTIYNKTLNRTSRFPSIERYCSNRTIIREAVSLSLGCEIKTIKRAFTSIAFGVRKNVKSYKNVDDNWSVPTLTEIFGNEKLAQSFIEHKEVKQLWNEVSEIFSGLSKATKSTLLELKSSQRVAYLYQHNEAMMLQEMMSFVGKSLVITKHDSIITSSPLSINQIKELQDKIYHKLGYKVSLSQGVL